MLLAALLVAAIVASSLIALGRGSPASPSLRVTVSTKASQSQIYAIRTDLLSAAGLSSCIWWSSYRHYIGPSRLVDATNAKPVSLHAKSTSPYFQCQLSSISDLTAAVRLLRDQPGVTAVTGRP